MSELHISRELINNVVSHCKASYPNEACGILAGDGNVIEKVYKMTNIEDSSVSYFMDSKEQFEVLKQLRSDNKKMVAIYHSHPNAQAYPSHKDVQLAFYEDATHVIVSLLDQNRPDIKAFEIREGRVSEIPIILSDNRER
jgi:proteasome lid subunit RPN8/RPN11